MISAIQQTPNSSANQNIGCQQITKHTLQEYILSNNVYPVTSSINKINTFIQEIPINTPNIQFVRINDGGQ
jgi:hypothetical protein